MLPKKGDKEKMDCRLIMVNLKPETCEGCPNMHVIPSFTQWDFCLSLRKKLGEVENRPHKPLDECEWKEVVLPPWMYEVKRLVISTQTGEWCKLPYPNHPKGCPVYGKADRCPPAAPPVGKVFDLSRTLYLVNSEFDLSAHVERMRVKHPQWSERQLRNVLYWQGTSRKQLRERLVEAKQINLDWNIFTATPEAMGVNIYVTARLSGLHLERIRGLKTCRHVALLGWKI